MVDTSAIKRGFYKCNVGECDSVYYFNGEMLKYISGSNDCWGLEIEAKHFVHMLHIGDPKNEPCFVFDREK